jgi:hypothetical protein
MVKIATGNDLKQSCLTIFIYVFQTAIVAF